MYSIARRQHGLTLVELVITIVIISTAVAGVVGAFSLVVGRSADPLWQTRSTELARTYLGEILGRKWDEATPNGGIPAIVTCTINRDESDRADFDDVDDYHDIGGSPDLLFGNFDDVYANYTVQVQVTCAGDDLGLANDAAKRVQVTVTPPGQSPVVFSAYKANY